MQDTVAFTIDDFDIPEDVAVDICGKEVLVKAGLGLTETIGLYPCGNDHHVVCRRPVYQLMEIERGLMGENTRSKAVLRCKHLVLPNLRQDIDAALRFAELP